MSVWSALALALNPRRTHLFEARRLDAVVGLDGEEDLVDRAQHVFDLADLLFVFLWWVGAVISFGLVWFGLVRFGSVRFGCCVLLCVLCVCNTCGIPDNPNNRNKRQRQRQQKQLEAYKVNGCVEIGDLFVGGFADEVFFGGVDELADLHHSVGRAGIVAAL